MDNEQKYNIRMAYIILVGVVLTITVGVAGSIYNHQKNIERDKYLIEKCSGIAYKDGRGDDVNYNYTVKCDSGIQGAE